MSIRDEKDPDTQIHTRTRTSMKVETKLAFSSAMRTICGVRVDCADHEIAVTLCAHGKNVRCAVCAMMEM